jgi:hypothetical protein
MTLRIDLPSEIEQQLQHEATARGLTMEDYVRQFLQEQLPPQPVDHDVRSITDRTAAVQAAMGQFRHMPTSSDAYSHEKRAEMEGEDRL